MKYLQVTSDTDIKSYKCSQCSSVYKHKNSLRKHFRRYHFSNQSSNVVSFSIPSLNHSSSSLQPFNSPPSKHNPSNPISLDIPSSNSPSSSIQSYNLQYQDMIPTNASDPPPVLSTDDQCITYPSQIFQPSDHNHSAMNECPYDKENESPGPPSLYLSSLMPEVTPAQILSTSDMPLLEDSWKHIPEGVQSIIHTQNLPIYDPYPRFRCLHCVFYSEEVADLNEHFKQFHLSVLDGIQSFCFPMTAYQTMLFNQFNTVVQTISEPMEVFNSTMVCFICHLQSSSRYDMIQHIGLVHNTDMVWVCLICGYGCQLQIELSDHFECHNGINLNNNHGIQAILPLPENILSGKVGSKKKKLKCIVCDVTFRYKNKLNIHMMMHSEHLSFGCVLCGHRSRWKYEEIQHVRKCRLSLTKARKTNVSNTYLMSLIQYYFPPPGDVLYNFMKKYNIKKLGDFCSEVVMDRSPDNEEQISYKHVGLESSNHLDIICNNQLYEEGHCNFISDRSDSGQAAEIVGTDYVSDKNDLKSDAVLGDSLKKCPWCDEFRTNMPSEMSSHFVDRHGDIRPFQI